MRPQHGDRGRPRKDRINDLRVAMHLEEEAALLRQVHERRQHRTVAVRKTSIPGCSRFYRGKER